jgi:hypothetical protein
VMGWIWNGYSQSYLFLVKQSKVRRSEGRQEGAVLLTTTITPASVITLPHPHSLAITLVDCLFLTDDNHLGFHSQTYP